MPSLVAINITMLDPICSTQATNTSADTGKSWSPPSDLSSAVVDWQLEATHTSQWRNCQGTKTDNLPEFYLGGPGTEIQVWRLDIVFCPTNRKHLSPYSAPQSQGRHDGQLFPSYFFSATSYFVLIQSIMHSLLASTAVSVAWCMNNCSRWLLCGELVSKASS